MREQILRRGPRTIRDIYRLARENAPSIIFFDEIDAIANKRGDSTTEGDKETARILMELLTNLDGFDNDSNLNNGKIVKTIFATNKRDARPCPSSNWPSRPEDFHGLPHEAG